VIGGELQLFRAFCPSRCSCNEVMGWETTQERGALPTLLSMLLSKPLWREWQSRWTHGVPAWDPSFVVLAMVASVEAIFLSTFVLISQNRIAVGARLSQKPHGGAMRYGRSGPATTTPEAALALHKRFGRS